MEALACGAVPIMKAASPQDFRDIAKRRLPKFLFEYIDGGSYAEYTLGRNITDLEQVAIRQRVLRDVSGINLSTELFGQKTSMPVALAPVGLAGMNARRGEIQTVRAADKSGIPFSLSTVSTCSIEEVAGAAQKPFWFQLYMMRDRGFMRDLLARAEEAGCSTLIFTVDMPVPGSRYRDYRSGLAGASGLTGSVRRGFQAMLKPGWLWDVGLMGRPHTLGNVAPLLGRNTGMEDFFAWMRANFDPTVTWQDLEFVRSEWKRPLIVKGILDADDAVSARECGVDGIIVSNHGGRQLDGVPSSVRALPAIVEEVGESLTVLVDGGIRSGLDVVRMIALGAHGVLFGRSWVYALADGGEGGVSQFLSLIEAEMHVAMALTGATKIAEINTGNLVFPTNPAGHGLQIFNR